MTNIYDPISTFDFNKLTLNKPLLINGNYFIKYSIDGNPLYIQPPKSSIKQMILHKSSKKSYCDLLFSQENDEFIKWMETLEVYSQEIIFKNRTEWFESELEMVDIENSFTSPLKSYKSGTYYVCRTNMTQRLGKITVKIYDESETDLPIEDISGNKTVITILELQGIKCSAKNFLIEIELKQMMVLNPVDLFEKCILKTSVTKKEDSNITKTDITPPDITQYDNVSKENDISNKDTYTDTLIPELKIHTDLGKSNETLEDSNDSGESHYDVMIPKDEPIKMDNELTEIDFDLAEISDTETLQIKARDHVYYELYRKAKQKAKIAKDLALSAYLEAKEIKNKYMLEDVSESDSEYESENEE
jgi:hypothetical protein